MKYIWNALIKAKISEIFSDDLEFQISREINPYIETIYENLNDKELRDTIIEVNPLLRFQGIFQHFLNGDMDDNPELRDALFDVLIHFLAKIDIYQGMSREEYHGRFLKNDIENAVFDNNKESLKLFKFSKRRIIVEHLVKLYKLSASVELLAALLAAIYPETLIYADENETRDLLIYIGTKETPLLEKQVEFLLHMFAPIEHTIYLFWDMHFGIITVDETMVIDEIMVY